MAYAMGHSLPPRCGSNVALAFTFAFCVLPFDFVCGSAAKRCRISTNDRELYAVRACFGIMLGIVPVTIPMPSATPRLTVRDALGNQREIEISRTPFTLGRQSDNDLTLLDSRISRRHARINKDDHGYVLEDDGSRHGTFVNGQRIAGPHRLLPGDQIGLGVTDS